MRLQSVFISQYKNLVDFKIDFDNDHFIDVLVGKNGSGKSNLIEALVIIFNHLSELGKSTRNEILFNYEVAYEIAEKRTTIKWENGELYIDKEKRKALGKTVFPDNILVYYSGHNSTIPELIKNNVNTFKKRIKDARIEEGHCIIGIGSEYKSVLLCVLLLLPDEHIAKHYILQKLGIKQQGMLAPDSSTVSKPVFKIVLQRPEYARGKKEYDVSYSSDYDAGAYEQFWNIEGITRNNLNRLVNCVIEVDWSLDNGYFEDKDSYIYYIGIEEFQKEFSELKSRDIFQFFDNLKVLGMLEELSVPVLLNDNKSIDTSQFSDGQFQSIYIYALAEIFKEKHCLALLDEPDAFLHPEWQANFLEQVNKISGDTVQNNYILMSSHSAITLSKYEKDAYYFQKENEGICCKLQGKKELVQELSQSYIRYTEDESQLLINNVIRSSNKPILFVEGITDVSILNTAYHKLYPDKDCPILIQDAFDRGFISILMKRDELYKNYPDKKFFCLFDFDDAYENWRELKGDLICNDVFSGLCHQIKKRKNAYAFMLPVIKTLENQVWDASADLEKVKVDCHYCIEHVFWKENSVHKSWFKKDNGKILFKKGDKNKIAFAKNIDSLNQEDFEPFRPMFEKILSICS